MVPKEDFAELLRKCIVMTLEEAQKQVTDPLPKEVSLGLGAFEQRGKEFSVEEMLSFLYRDGTFPRIIDIAVRGIKEGRTFIWIRPSGHVYVDDFSQTWNTPEGMGPFKNIGLVLPMWMWNRSRQFSLQDLKEAAEKW